MTLGKILGGYLEEHHISQREFAIMCNCSNGYISMIVNEKNPQTGKPIKPSLLLLYNIARAMGMTANQLFSLADDICVDLGNNENPPNSEEDDGERNQVIELFNELSPDGKKLVVRSILEIAEQEGLV